MNSHLDGTKPVLYALASIFGSLLPDSMLVSGTETSQSVGHTGFTGVPQIPISIEHRAAVWDLGIQETLDQLLPV